jgi:uncharacterized protein YbbC (DUF1343 family)
MIKPGIDVLLERGLGDLRGAALGLLTGAGGVTSDLVPTRTALGAHPDARLVALFGAEHGLRGAAAAGERVPSGRDAATGLPVHSLYGETREPTDAMLAGLEAIVVDLQDVGLRYYTYPSTVLALLRAAAVHGIAVVVLDRPDPLTGTILEGPVAEPAFRSFVGAALVPVRHGLTLGELAGWMNARDDIGADLRVVAMDGWRRGMWFDDMGVPWVPPSPNIPSLAACVAYTATCLIEGTTVSEGRGTTQPFEVIGAPWVDADTLAARLNDLNLAGVRFRPTWFRPTTSKHAGHTCGGVQLHVVDRIAFAGVRTGLHVLATLRSLYPEQVTWVRGESGSYVVDLLLGTDAPRRAIERGDDVDGVAALWQGDLEVFRAARRPFLLYDE